MHKKCASNSYIYTKNLQIIQNLNKAQTKNSLKLEIYVFCTYNVQTIQNLYNYLTETAFVCFLCIQIMCKLYKIYTTETAFVCLLYIQTMYRLYKMYTNVNRVIYAPADVLHV